MQATTPARAANTAAQDTKLKAILDGSWKLGGTYGPRAIGTDTEALILESVERDAVKKFMGDLVKKGVLTLKDKDNLVWFNPDDDTDIDYDFARDQYFGDPDSGPARVNARDATVAARLAARKAKAETTKAANAGGKKKSIWS